ncbi:hypothetical protein ACFYUK_29525 [Nonomuraea wenchangensis]
MVRPLLDMTEPQAWRSLQPFIDATPLIRFPAAWSDRSSMWIKPIHRRLLSTGLTWRADLAFVIKWREGVGPRTATALAQRIFNLPVRISGQERPLRDFDQVLAADLLQRTTRKGHSETARLISSGRPLFFVDEVDTARNKIAFQATSTILGARPISTFVLRRREFHVDEARFIRTELFRTYHQLETLRLVLRARRSYPDVFDAKLIRDVLASQLKRLSRRGKKGYLQPNVMGIAATVAEFPISDLILLADDLRGESKGLMRQMKDLAEIIDKSSQQQVEGIPINCTVTLERLEVNTGDSFNFNDQAAGVFGRDNTVQGNTFVAGSNTSQSINLGNLMSAVSQLREHLDADSATDLDVASAEINEADSPQKIKSALQKIAGIATMAGSAGTAVIEAVKSVADALAIGQ